MGVLAALFMWKFVPETKGKTLEKAGSALGTGNEENTTNCYAVIFLSSTPRHFGVLTFYSRFSRFELHSHRVITSNRIAAE